MHGAVVGVVIKGKGKARRRGKANHVGVWARGSGAASVTGERTNP